jgi:hypothetical protein
MRFRYLFIIAGLALFITACKKDIQVTLSTHALVGKWYLTKQNIHLVDNGKVADTTFSGSSFNGSDFFQFNSDDTALFSVSDYYTLTGKIESTNGAGTPSVSTQHFKYSVADSTLMLQITDILPTAVGSNTTPYIQQKIVHFDAAHITLQTIYYSPDDATGLTTSYFTKGN